MDTSPNLFEDERNYEGKKDPVNIKIKPDVRIRNAGYEIYLLDPKILNPNSITK